MDSNPLRMVRELKGAPLSIVIALSIVQQRVTQSWLESTTGYTDKTISKALDYLREIDLVNNTSYGWQLTEGYQLRLSDNGRRNSDSTTTALINNIDSAAVVEEVEAENFRLRSEVKNLAAMKSVGIGANKTTRKLAAMDHVTPEYIRAHARAEKRLGLAITRMLNAEPPPKHERSRSPEDYKEWDQWD